MTCLPLDHVARLHSATALSTGEAEVCSIAEAVFRGVAPIQWLFEQATGAPVPSEVFTDSSAARLACEAGHSRRMAYIRKHQGVTLGAVRDWFQRWENRLRAIRSEENAADVLTKPLESEAHWRHVRSLSLGPPPRTVAEEEDLHWVLCGSTEFAPVVA